MYFLSFILSFCFLFNIYAMPSSSGEYIVKVKEGHKFALSREGTIKDKVGQFYLVKSDRKDFFNLIGKNENVEYVEPNYIYHPVSMNNQENEVYLANDPKFERQWGLYNTGKNPTNPPNGVKGADLNVIPAWKIEKGDPNFIIAVIDGGVDVNHEDLKENIWINLAEKNGKPGIDDDKNGFIDDINGFDFAYNTGEIRYPDDHGTHCAGTIGAVQDNGIGLTGVMPNVKIMTLNFFTKSGDGETFNAIKAIYYAVQMGAKVLNNSWGGEANSKALKEAIVMANEKGVIFVAAAGNSSEDNDLLEFYPANYELDNVITVGAYTYRDELASFSSYGKNKVHVTAPGMRIYSTLTGNKYMSLTGTSMAAPLVSGAIGLLLSKEPSLSPAAVKERIIKTSTPSRYLYEKSVSNGRVNIHNLLLDKRHDVTMPDESSWVKVKLDIPTETEHPYPNYLTKFYPITIPGAKKIRAIIKRYDFYDSFDYIRVYAKRGRPLQKLIGKGSNYRTSFADGDTIRIKVKTSHRKVSWGMLIDEVEVIY